MRKSKSKRLPKLDFGGDPTSPSVMAINYERRLDASQEIIFHYCSAESFRLIVKNRTIRFSDALCLNDGEEIAWANSQLEIALQRIVDRDNIDDNVPPVAKAFLDEFRNALETLRQEARHFVASFSSTGDSLSQWRAYADDGQGFAIGFCVNHIDIPAAFWRVEYEVEKQQAEIIAFIGEMYRLSKRNKNYLEKQLQHDVFYFHSVLSSYKNPAFVDEREVRGAHRVALRPSGPGNTKFEFIGGSVARVGDVDEGEIDYRVARGRLVPFTDFKFQLGSPCALCEVWMGPRCATPKDDLSRFLHTMGLEAVAIKRAGSSYRG